MNENTEKNSNSEIDEIVNNYKNSDDTLENMTDRDIANITRKVETIDNLDTSSNEESKDDERKLKKGVAREIFEFVESFIQILVVLVIVFTFFFRIVGVDGDSMLPTLENNDRLIITSSFFYNPKQGDIVIDTQPIEGVEGPIVKRVIATAGQTVDIDETKNIVMVDGKELNEPYLGEYGITEKKDLEFPITLKEGEIILFGDNRKGSLDSRFSKVGVQDERYILGKAIFRIYPFNKFGKIE